jgi:hypothetical protein
MYFWTVVLLMLVVAIRLLVLVDSVVQEPYVVVRWFVEALRILILSFVPALVYPPDAFQWGHPQVELVVLVLVLQCSPAAVQCLSWLLPLRHPLAQILSMDSK